MPHINRSAGLAVLAVYLLFILTLGAQQAAVLGPDELGKLVPGNFYFEGQLAPTQMRNAAAVSLAPKRHVIAALVDTSGYASNIRSKFEGFLITDVPVTIGGTQVKPGAYGFGFTEQPMMNIMDVAGDRLYSIKATKDEKLQSPRPLAIVQSGKDLRLYRGRNYVVLVAK